MNKTTKVPGNRHFTLKCDEHRVKHLSYADRVLRACHSCCTVMCAPGNKKKLRTAVWRHGKETLLANALNSKPDPEKTFREGVNSLPPRPRWVAEIIPYHYNAKTFRAEMLGIVFVYDARMTETNCSADSLYEFQGAVHEAGHAVAALLMGMRATLLSVDPYPDEASLDADFDCDHLPLDSNESRKHSNWRRAVVACTGPTAENSDFGIGLQTAGNDLLHVAKLEQEAQLCEIELSLWRARAWCMAYSTAARNLGIIDSLAGVLMSRRSLMTLEIAAIFLAREPR